MNDPNVVVRLGLSMVAVFALALAGCASGGGGGGGGGDGDDGGPGGLNDPCDAARPCGAGLVCGDEGVCVEDLGGEGEDEGDGDGEGEAEPEDEGEDGAEDEDETEGEDEEEGGPPVADAGEDRNVSGGLSVTLDGRDSGDPDGDDLTYEWIQTAGTMVALANADSARPTFTAPNVTETLTFQLTVDDGHDGSSTDTVTVNITARLSVLFAVDQNAGVLGYNDPGDLDGEVAASNDLDAGSGTEIYRPRDVVVDARGALYVASSGNDSIAIYDDATSASGTRRPDRRLEGDATEIDEPLALAIDVKNDILFVANADTLARDEIKVFDIGPAEEFDGDVAPDRIITTGETTFTPFQMVFADGALYVATQVTNTIEILVFEEAGEINGIVRANREISGADFDQLLTIFVDGDDRLFVANRQEEVFMWNNASGLNGRPTPDLRLGIHGADTLTAVAVDSDDRMFVADNAKRVIHSVDSVSTRTSGTVMPDRTFEGDELRSPERLFLVEQ